MTTLFEVEETNPIEVAWAANFWLSRALIVTLAGWPTLMSPTSASLRSTLTFIRSRFCRTITALVLFELEEEEEVELDALEAVEPEVLGVVELELP